MTEKEKMLAGEFYNAMDRQLLTERYKARLLQRKINNNHPLLLKRMLRLEKKLINADGELFIQPPFYCDYGYNITVGDNFYANFGCVFLDVNRITIGKDVMLGPQVQIYSASHPLDPELRNREHKEMGIPVSIGDGVWIGGHSVICPGVHIGDNAVIGAGSVVTKDVPAGVVAVGNPCRVLREIPDAGE